MFIRATPSSNLNTEKKIKLNKGILKRRKSDIKRSSSAYSTVLLIIDRILSSNFFINSFYPLRTRIVTVIKAVLQILCVENFLSDENIRF